MKLLLKPLQVLFSIYALLVFIICMLIVFPFVLVASLWGKMKGGNFIYNISRVWADVWFFLIGIYHKNIFESALDKSKQYVFVANHISYLDIPTIFKAIRKRSIRVLGKAEMKKVPIFGFIYSRGAVMVDRNNSAVRTKSVLQLKSIIRKGISVVIFPEGTFNETHHPLKDFYNGAFRIAIETQTPILPVLFLNTYDRLHYGSIFSLAPGRSKAIFLEEVKVDTLTLKDVNALKNSVYELMEKKLIEYNASWIEKT
jgi:1-acyl-sn-glycerol-3-phosphate acyltransferase